MDLGNIRLRMAVLGSDGKHLGTVDHNRGKLRRDDAAAGSQHHWSAQDRIALVDGNTVRLGTTAGQARQSRQGKAGSPQGG